MLRGCEGVASALFPCASLVQPLYNPCTSLIHGFPLWSQMVPERARRYAASDNSVAALSMPPETYQVASASKPVFSVQVRELVEFALRQGDLGGRSEERRAGKVRRS